MGQPATCREPVRLHTCMYESPMKNLWSGTRWILAVLNFTPSSWPFVECLCVQEKGPYYLRSHLIFLFNTHVTSDNRYHHQLPNLYIILSWKSRSSLCFCLWEARWRNEERQWNHRVCRQKPCCFLQRTKLSMYNTMSKSWVNYEERRPLSNLHITVIHFVLFGVTLWTDTKEQNVTKQSHQFLFPLSRWEERPANEKPDSFPQAFQQAEASYWREGQEGDQGAKYFHATRPCWCRVYHHSWCLCFGSNKCNTAKFIKSIKWSGIHLSCICSNGESNI